jgi:UDP-N-acetylmuramate dehydrogenase
MIFEQDVVLSKFTTFKIGGTADYFCRVKNDRELKQAVFFAKQKKLPLFILGGGSNLLIRDGGFRGLVVKIEFSGIEFKNLKDGGIEVIAGAGENWDNFVGITSDKNFFGLENLSGIPGTVGGAVAQNAGAYGSETGSLIERVEVFDLEKMTIAVLSKADCKFAYRDSFFKTPAGRKFIITKAVFLLSKNGKTDIAYKDIEKYIQEEKMDSQNLTPKILRGIILKIRAGKMPDLVEVGTAGSFFKNPIVSKEKYDELKKFYPEMPFYKTDGDLVKIPLAWILDNICNLKGFKMGNAGLYEKQPLVLVNFGGATAKEINDLAEYISKIVKEKIGIEIEREEIGRAHV